jgi:protein-disulfide isomerase
VPSRLTLAVSGRDRAIGPANAAITVVAYGDYECFECARTLAILRVIQRRMNDRLRFVFRHFPLRTIHVNAVDAAEAAEAVAAQGRFWPMHDLLVNSGGELGPSALLRYARAAGADVERWQRDFKGHAFAARVQEDFMSGIRSGVNGTPTLFINGHRYDGALDEYGLQIALDFADPAA